MKNLFLSLKKFQTQDQSGQVLLLAIVAVGLVLVNTLVIIGGSQLFFQNTYYSVQAAQALNLAEAGIDKAIATLNATGGNYLGETEVSLGVGSFSVAITSPNPGTKIIESTGFIPSKDNPQVKRTIKVTAAKGVGVAFNYGVQVGEGGLNMSNGSKVEGSVYSNGNIVMNNNSRITGDAYVAGGMEPEVNQESQCSDLGCSDFAFGKNVNGSDRLDIAQSFRPSVADHIRKVALKLKKVGSPPDITVRLLGDNGGKPNKYNVLASGILTANLVTQNYGFVEISLNPQPTLAADTPYWIMLDTSSNASNFWYWSADSLQGYSGGQAMWSPDWRANTPSWNSVPLDLDFKVYMGGVATSIQGGGGVVIGGDAHANTLKNLTVTGEVYYQVIENVTASGFHPNSSDPAAQVMPVSEGNIATWKKQAEDFGVYEGNISSCRSSLNAGKYVGNISFTNNCVTTVQHPIWITGNLSLSNGAILKLNPSYGLSSGVIIVDGHVSLSNNVKIKGTGEPGSYLMLLTTYDSRTNDAPAISVSNSGNEGILYAPYGKADIANNNHLTELTAWKISLGNNVEIDYDEGLASAFFSSGPTGAFSIVKGTYQLK